MNIKKKKILLLIIPAAIFWIILIKMIVGLFTVEIRPKELLVDSFPSPTGRYTLNLYLNNGGATTDFSITGELVDNESLKSRKIYWEYHQYSAVCKWIDDEHIFINGHTLNVKKDSYNYEDEVFDDNFWKEASTTYKDQYKDYTMYEKNIIVYEYDSVTGEKGKELFEVPDFSLQYEMEANATLDLKETEFEPEYVMEVIYEDAEDREQVREILFSVDKNGGNFCVKNVSEYVYRYREKEMKKLLKVCESTAFLLY